MADQPSITPNVEAFFDEATNTISYVVSDPGTAAAAIVDSVLDYDPASGRTADRSAERIIAYVRERGLSVEWILETHVHADHLSAAAFLKGALGGRTGIGRHIAQVQAVFGDVFNAGPDFARDGSQFDALFEDGDSVGLGGLRGRVLHTPGHTPACVTYVFGAVAFVGDTLFMPDYGSARCDFPGGDAGTLYRSIQKIFALPDATRLFMCHDYKAPGRDAYAWETTVGAEKRENIHLREGVSEAEFVEMRTSEAEFVEMRTARDAGLAMPRLILPSIQVNMRAGEMPPAEDNGTVYLKIPVDRL